MAELSYSSEAENILNKFYRVDTLVYVEGSDDILFWEYIFNKFADYSVKVNDVGGSSEIVKYTHKIEAGEIEAIVACDADFSYIGSFPTHQNIIRSYGYSIENSIICHNSLKEVIASLGRVSPQSIDDKSISNWFEQLTDATKDLVIHDIANDIEKAGKSVTGNNCTKFMKSNTSSEICPNKIKKHLACVNLKMSKRLKNRIITSLADSDRTEYDFLRGHFLFSASLKYVSSSVKKLGRRGLISNDSFFGVLFLAFKTVFSSTHSHYNYYQNIVHKVAVSA